MTSRPYQHPIRSLWAWISAKIFAAVLETSGVDLMRGRVR